MDEDFTMKAEIYYNNEHILDFPQKKSIKLCEIKEAIKKELNIQNDDSITFYQIDDKNNAIKEILNDDDLLNSKKKISTQKYLLKLKVNINKESQNNSDMVLSEISNDISQIKIEDDEYTKKIEELQKELLEEKKKEEEEDIDFEEKMKLIEEKQKKEIKSLNEEINKMKQKIKNNKVINITNFEINDDLTKFLQKKLVEDLTNTINNYIDNYDKKVNEKINEIKKKLNKQANSMADGQFNKILSEVKSNNDNILDESIKNQNEIMKNINNIKIELNLKDNKKVIQKNDNNVDNKDLNNNLLNENTHNSENSKNGNKTINKDSNNPNIHYDDNLEKESEEDLKESITKNNNVIRKQYKHRPLRNDNINNENKKNELEEGEINECQDEPKNTIKVLQTKKNNKFSNSNNINVIGNNNSSQEEKNKSYFIKMMNPKTDIQKKKPKQIYSSMNKVFFTDFQQKNVKYEKIKEIELNQLKKEIEKEFNEGKFVLKNYSQNYIEENVLPIFKKKIKLNNEQFEVLKYNIEKILECCGLPKDFYSNEIYQQNIKKNEIDRKKSIDALRKFRREFGITEKEFNDEGIMKRLEENGLDINKTFQKMFG